MSVLGSGQKNLLRFVAGYLAAARAVKLPESA